MAGATTGEVTDGKLGAKFALLGEMFNVTAKLIAHAMSLIKAVNINKLPNNVKSLKVQKETTLSENTNGQTQSLAQK